MTTAATPRRIIAQVSAASALSDFGVPVVGTFGPLVRGDGSTEPEADSVDPRRVTDITGPTMTRLADRLEALLAEPA